MPNFSKSSTKKLNTLDLRLQFILLDAIKIFDFSIICGHRDEEAQNNAFKGKMSKLEWPKSKHNTFPSIAVDLAPYPIDWENRDRFIFLAGIIYYIAQQSGTKIRFGGNWSVSYQFEDQSFDDLVHFEIVE